MESVSSLAVLEEFYGEALSDELLQRIYGTDDEQLAVLAWQLVERLPIVDAEVATPWDPRFNRGRPETLLAHEALLTQLPHHQPLSTQTRCTDQLYLDTLVVRDPLLMWAEAVHRLEDDLEDAETDDASEVFEREVFEYFGEVPAPRPWGPAIARIAAGLLPLRTLILNGVIRLVSAPRISWRDAQPLMSNNVALDAVIASKPAFVRQILSEHPELAARYDPTDELDRYILGGLILTRHEDHLKTPTTTSPWWPRRSSVIRLLRRIGGTRPDTGCRPVSTQR